MGHAGWCMSIWILLGIKAVDVPTAVCTNFLAGLACCESHYGGLVDRQCDTGTGAEVVTGWWVSVDRELLELSAWAPWWHPQQLEGNHARLHNAQLTQQGEGPLLAVSGHSTLQDPPWHPPGVQLRCWCVTCCRLAPWQLCTAVCRAGGQQQVNSLVWVPCAVSSLWLMMGCFCMAAWAPPLTMVTPMPVSGIGMHKQAHPRMPSDPT
jgi:hypothetical protein